MKLKEIREERKMSRETLAEQVGVSARVVGRWETGERVPDMEKQEKIASCLGVSAEELEWKKKGSRSVGNVHRKKHKKVEQKKLLCPFRTRTDKYDKKSVYFRECEREGCAMYRDGKCGMNK